MLGDKYRVNFVLYICCFRSLEWKKKKKIKQTEDFFAQLQKATWCQTQTKSVKPSAVLMLIKRISDEYTRATSWESYQY